MSQVTARGGAREIVITAIVTRADGTVENLGVISRWHRNPVINWFWKAWGALNVILYDRQRAG